MLVDFAHAPSETLIIRPPEFFNHLMMLESVGFREVAVQCGYTDSDRANPEAELIFIAKR